MTTPLALAEVPLWTLTDRVRKAREHAGLSQEELADVLQVARSTIGNWESGRTTPSWRDATLLADVCRVDRQWLIGDAELRRRRIRTRYSACIFGSHTANRRYAHSAYVL